MFGAQSPQNQFQNKTAYEIDEEVRSLLNEARNKAAEIIQSNRETHKLIAEALLKYETLDSTQLKLFMKQERCLNHRRGISCIIL